MKAIGRNLLVNMTRVGVSETKGGLLLGEKQREDIRYTEGTVLSVGSDVVGINENDLIYFDKNNYLMVLGRMFCMLLYYYHFHSMKTIYYL